MNTTHTTEPQVILIKKGALSDRGISELRKAGYRVVQSENPADVKGFYPENFNRVSDKAKILAFETAIHADGSGVYTGDGLRALYVRCLKSLGGF